MKKQTKLGLVLAAAAVISVSVASLVSAKGWVQKGADWYYVDNDGEAITDTIQSSGTAKFYLGADDGAMQKDYFLEDKDGQSYYFGSNGAMVTNTWVAIESSRVDNQGDYVPDNYWYYFQASGKAMKGTSGNPKKTTIDGKKYLFNENGQMLTGWIDSNGSIINPDDESNPFKTAVYYAGGDNDGVLRSGWVTYYDGYDGDDEEYLSDKTNLYFYFNPSNNVMVGKKKDGSNDAKTKKINGKTYAFDQYGVMLSGWDVVNDSDALGIDSLKHKSVYFSGEDDGHQVKKGWVYTVPASGIDNTAYEDGEEKYMYFNSAGEAVADTFKKINGKYYVFAENGIMKTGLVIWAEGKYLHTDGTKSKYVNKLDFDWAEGSDVKKKGILQTDSNDFITVSPKGQVIRIYKSNDTTTYTKDIIEKYDDKRTTDPAQYSIANVKLHLFGEDGARKTGTNTVEFSDDAYSICTNAQGDKGSGNFAKKYYALGIVLKASSDIKFGIYASDINSQFTSQSAFYSDNLLSNKYQVLTTSGSLQKGASSAKKDADGNYWFIEKSSNILRGIWTVNVKRNTTTFVFKQNIEGTGTHTWTSTADDNAWDTIKNLDIYDSDETVADLVDGNLYYVESAKFAESNASGYGTLTITYSGLWFQSDYNGSSNKWIPFNVYDDGTKTAKLRYNALDPGKYYQLEPTNDYFLNCYWSED